ncbi:lysylphosphatidylglycerol synthetase family protein [Saccharibacter sp. 17.LH.SD]|nr:lysylphosphatidylglycerol synthetase family protein [Saccharibacter sp. 17.LH.SD]
MMRAPALFGAVLLVVAVVVIWRELRHLSVHDIVLGLHAIPVQALWKGVGATFLAYFILSFYDGLACRHVNAGVSWGRSAFVAFCSYVLSHNIGCAAVSGTAVRYRLYRSWGVPSGKIASIIAFCSLTYLLGTIGLVGFVLLWQPQAIPFLSHAPLWISHCAGIGCFGALLAYVGLSIWKKEIKIYRWRLDLPRWDISIAQILISMADMSVTALIAWCVIGPLPPGTGLNFGGFLAIYIVAYTAGLVASVPGGLGVFDSAMLLALSPWLPLPRIMGAILVFRLFYYIIPLILAGVMFAGHELLLRGMPSLSQRPGQGGILHPNQVVRESEADFSVIVATSVQAVLGIVTILYALLAPLPVFHSVIHATILQLSAFLLWLCGVILFGLAGGLSQRVALAWRLSVYVLCATLVVLGLRQAHWAVFLFVAAVLVVLLPFKKGYYRQAHWRVEPLSPSILAPISLWAVGLAGVGWVGLQRHLGPVWWRAMIYDAHTAIGRWFMGISALCCLFALWRAVRRTRLHPLPWNLQNAAKYGCLVDAATTTHMLRDVKIMPDGIIQDESAKAALAFIKRDPFLVSLGSPVGVKAFHAAAIWRLRDYAVQEGYGLVFLQDDTTLRDIYEDIGLNGFVLKKGGYCFCNINQYPLVQSYLDRLGLR